MFARVCVCVRVRLRVCVRVCVCVCSRASRGMNVALIEHARGMNVTFMELGGQGGGRKIPSWYNLEGSQGFEGVLIGLLRMMM